MIITVETCLTIQVREFHYAKKRMELVLDLDDIERLEEFDNAPVTADDVRAVFEFANALTADGTWDAVSDDVAALMEDG